MKCYVIRRKKDGKFVSGTDYHYYPPHSILISSADYRTPLLLPINKDFIETEINRRGINMKNYELILVELKELV